MQITNELAVYFLWRPPTAGIILRS